MIFDHIALVTTPMSLQRFHEAQASLFSGYDPALAEIRRGRKSGHWIWYIFPQLTALGRSSSAQYYGIGDLAEARAFLRDPVLRARYAELAGAVRDQLTRGIELRTLMGCHLDALKFISSLTLFRDAAGSVRHENVAIDNLAALCSSILTVAESQGFAPCDHTLKLI